MSSHGAAIDAFWGELRLLAEENRRTPIALGVVTLLITRVMGDFAPEALTTWTVDCLPPGARLWVEMYGRRSALANSSGSKLYLLLQRELEASGVPAKRTLRSTLLPFHLPPTIFHATANESLSMRLRRHRNQLYFISLRLRFHIVEGLRYFGESLRWAATQEGTRAMMTVSNSPLRALWRASLLGFVLSGASALLGPAYAQTAPAGSSSGASSSLSSAGGAEGADTTSGSVFGFGLDDSASTGSAAGATAGAGSSVLLGPGLGNGAPIPLTADQIFAILQEQPDALIELKSLVADLAQQQGAPIQPEAITDEMLYSKITSSAELRGNITTFLRARGYISDDDLQSYAAGTMSTTRS